MAKLQDNDVICIEVLRAKGHSNRNIAREFNVDESTIRYRLKRLEAGTTDGRKNQPEACEPYDEVIQAWMDQQSQQRPEPIKILYELLVTRYGYSGSYRSVLRYIRRRAPAPKVRPIRRVETAVGAQVQIDWVLGPWIYIEEFGGRVRLQAFLMILSHSRMWSVIWSVGQDILLWLDCHNKAFIFLGGVAATARIDNLKTGVASGAGPWAKLHHGYASYARQMGFEINPCRVRTPSDKGKVERRGRDVKHLQIREGEHFASLRHLQEVTNRRIIKRAQSLLCPISGLSIYETWQGERSHLKPLPRTLPAPFDVQVCRKVQRDCLVNFEGRQYSVPFVYVGRMVEVRGCPQTVEIYCCQSRIASYPRHTPCRLLLDQSHYEGQGTNRIIPPTPLGKVARQIVLRHSWEAREVPTHGIEQYAELVEALS